MNMFELFMQKYNDFLNKTGVKPNKCYMTKNAFNKILEENNVPMPDVKMYATGGIYIDDIEICLTIFFKEPGTQVVFTVV